MDEYDKWYSKISAKTKDWRHRDICDLAKHCHSWRMSALHDLKPVAKYFAPSNSHCV